MLNLTTSLLFMTGLVRKCQYVTKTDDCTLRVEYGNCDMERKGICFTGMNTHLIEQVVKIAANIQRIFMSMVLNVSFVVGWMY